MGILDLLGLALGPVESLSFAVVIGVSVDYLAHFAYAYKNSLMREHYYKSRAVFLARSGSVSASAATTLCAVLPLLGAQIQPLLLFGIIFTVVALVSVAFALGLFQSLMMVFGPGVPLESHQFKDEDESTTSSTFDVRVGLKEGGSSSAPAMAPTETDAHREVRQFM